MCIPSSNGRVEAACLTVVDVQSSLGHAFAVETVAKTAQRDEVPRPIWLRLDLLAQVRDLVVDDAIGDMGVASPHFIEQLGACKQPAGSSHEGRQQLELERRQLDSCPGPTKPKLRCINCAHNWFVCDRMRRTMR